jgi:hypothetical protein
VFSFAEFFVFGGGGVAAAHMRHLVVHMSLTMGRLRHSDQRTRTTVNMEFNQC